MTGREKIIITLMALACIYGIYNFFYTPSESNTSELLTGKGEELNKFMVDVAEKINIKADSDTDAYVLKIINTEWEKDPFMEPGYILETGNESFIAGLVQNTRLTYSGYIKTDDRMLAIINNAEYEEGDVIEPGGYLVQRITPAEVVLIGKRHKIHIKLDEQDHGEF